MCERERRLGKDCWVIQRVRKGGQGVLVIWGVRRRRGSGYYDVVPLLLLHLLSLGQNP